MNLYADGTQWESGLTGCWRRSLPLLSFSKLAHRDNNFYMQENARRQLGDVSWQEIIIIQNTDKQQRTRQILTSHYNNYDNNDSNYMIIVGNSKRTIQPYQRYGYWCGKVATSGSLSQNCSNEWNRKRRTLSSCFSSSSSLSSWNKTCRSTAP